MNTEAGPPPQVQSYKNIILFGGKKKRIQIVIRLSLISYRPNRIG